MFEYGRIHMEMVYGEFDVPKRTRPVVWKYDVDWLREMAWPKRPLLLVAMLIMVPLMPNGPILKVSREERGEKEN